MKVISVRIKHNSATKHAGQRAHDLRTSKEKLDYVDYERLHLNSVVIQPKTSAKLRQICEQHRNTANYKRRMKSNAAVATDGIITFSKEAQKVIEDLSIEEQNERFKAVAEAIAKHLNTTLEGLVVHRDESAIHAHFTLAAYTTDGKPLSKTTNRQTTSKLQDIAAEVVQDLGIGRGKSKQQRIADGEPAHKWINRSVRQLHSDLPKEIAELEKRIEELNQQVAEATEKADKAARNLERTEQKLREAGEENERLQKRLETYQKRLESAEEAARKAEAAKADLEAEIERLKKLIEPQKPESIQIQHLTGWEESGWGPFKRKEPVLEPAEVITPKAAENALIATRKAAEEDAKRKAEQDVQDELDRLRQLQDEREQLFNAIEQAAEIGRLPCVESPPASPYSERKTPPEIIHYDATLLDYGERLVAAGDGTLLQQAAALYKEAHERWPSALFWGMNEAQIEWLVKAAEEDGYSVEFAEPWAQKHAAEVRRQLMTQQNETAAERNFDL